MSTFQITRKMASVMKESNSDDFVNLSNQLGSLVLKEEQKLAVEALLSGKDVMAVLPTGFGKSIIYQSFVIVKYFANMASITVVVPLRSIIEDQLQSNDFGLKAVAFKRISKLLKGIGANKHNVIFASAEQALSAEFTTRCLNMILKTAFQLSCATFLITLRAFVLSIFFYSGP